MRIDKLSAYLTIDWEERREARRKTSMTTPITTTTAEDTHMPPLVSRSLTPSRTKTKIRLYPNMCCFAWSYLFVASPLPGQVNLCYSLSCVSTRTCFLLLSLLLSSSFSLPWFLSRLLCNISWLCLCLCSLVWEIVLFVHLCCAILENGCKDSRNVEIKLEKMFIQATVFFSCILGLLFLNKTNVKCNVTVCGC